MDIRLEAADGQAPPLDTFVSLRVGDVQKQSRFAKVRQFRFQDPGDGRGAFGRLEVFRRVGHLTVSFANVGDGELQQVEVPCSLPGMSTLKLGLAVTGGRTGPDKEMAKTARIRRDEAQKYLTEKRLEETLALAMREVVQVMPDDACGYLSSAILRLSGAAGTGIASQQDSEDRRVAPAAEEPLPTEASKDDALASERGRRGDIDHSSVGTEARGTLQGILVDACATGKLDTALGDAHQRPLAPAEAPAEAEADDMDAVRENAQAILLSASRDGKLEEVLESVGRQPPQGDGAVAAEGSAEMRQPVAGAAEAEAAEGSEAADAAGPGADQDVDVLRDRAKKAFLDAGLNGKLEETLSSMSTSGELASTLALIEKERPPPTDPGPAKAGVPESSDALREQVQATFSKACLSGELGQTLRTVKGARGAAARQEPAEPVDVVDETDDKAYTFAAPAFGAEQGAAPVEPTETAHRTGAEDPAPGPEHENELVGPAGADGAAPPAEELVGSSPPPAEPQGDAEEMEEPPSNILDRSHSCMVKMPPQEIITSFMQEIEKKDQEIEELEKQLEGLNIE